MEEKPFTLRAHQVPDSIRMLRRLNVRATHLASLFKDSAENIRQIDKRASSDASTPGHQVISIRPAIAEFAEEDDDYWTQMRKSGPLFLRENSRRRMERLEQQILSMRKRFGQRALEPAIRILRKRIPKVIRAQQGLPLRVKTLLYAELAWYQGHAGYSTSCLEDSNIAMQCAKDGYSSSFADPYYLHQYSGAALTASLALELSHRPQQAIWYLNEAAAAEQAATGEVGSETQRQLATAYLMMGNSYDEQAKKAFAGARKAALKSGANDLTLEMTGPRQARLLEPISGWDDANQLAVMTETQFGYGSLQHRMAVNWAGAVGLLLETSSPTHEAGDRLLPVLEKDLQFGHQATVTELLRITPELKLTGNRLNRWVRFLLYENAFRKY
jgi:hypothetical protein